MSVKIQGNTGTIAQVDADNQLLVQPTQVIEKAGFALMASENDAGEVTGTRYVLSPETSEDFRLRVGMDSVFFNEQFPGAALNSAIWTAPVTTATLTVAGGAANLNAGLSTASGAVARLTTYRSFPLFGTFPAAAEMLVQFAQLPVTNNICEWGFVLSTGTAAPTDGAFFRLNATAEFRAVVNFNGAESQSAPLDFAALVGNNKVTHFIVVLGEDTARFWIDDILVATIVRPVGQSAMTASNNLPLSFRIYNTAATSAAQVMKVGLASVNLGDMEDGKFWHHMAAGWGANAAQGQTGGTMGSTALYTNSLAPGAGAAATNTTAALGSGLGGQFALLPTLAANTDGIISSYQVPLGTAALPGKSLYITGVRIQGIVSTILAGGPILGIWSLAFGHTSVSLVTAEAATTKASRRIPLGIQTFPATAAVGVQADRDINVRFEVPVVVQPGEFIQTVLKNIGTVTTTGVITFLVAFDGYWE